MPTRPNRRQADTAGVLRSVLTFEKLMTGPVIHWIYWAGLGVILLGAFGAVGAAVGVALKEQEIVGKLLAFPLAVAGLLVCVILVLIWRSICEFYVAVFRIADDLQGLRAAAEREMGSPVNTGGPPQRPFAG
jgi:hypothetical protein